MDGRRSAPHFQVFTSSLLQRAPNPFYCVYFSPLHPPAQKKSLAQKVKVCPGEILSTCAAYQCKDFGCKSTCIFFFLTTACIYIYIWNDVYTYIYIWNNSEVNAEICFKIILKIGGLKIPQVPLTGWPLTLDSWYTGVLHPTYTV